MTFGASGHWLETRTGTGGTTTSLKLFWPQPMAPWTTGWMDGWMGGWMDGWMDGWVGEWMGGWLGGSIDDWLMVGGWMDK